MRDLLLLAIHLLVTLAKLLLYSAMIRATPTSAVFIIDQATYGANKYS